MDADKTYAMLGRFIVLFQHLENTIVQIIRLIEQPKAGYDIRSDLAELRFTDLLKRMRNCTIAYTKSLDLVNYQQFENEFVGMYEKCISLSKRRNDLVHSTYFHVEAGGELHSIIRTKTIKLKRPNRKNNHEFLITYEGVKLDPFNQSMTDLLSLDTSLRMLYNQLIHWKDSRLEPKSAGKFRTECTYKST